MKSLLAITAVVFTIGFVSIPVVWGDNDHDSDDDSKYQRKSNTMNIKGNATYREECGSCHMAYPSELLPSRSWLALMSGLDKHFGDNAELGTQTQQEITTFLQENSADKSNYRLAGKFNRSIKAKNTPLRISETPYFIRKHDEIPARLVKDNPQVKSFSNCNACHTKAEQGVFNEHDINIAGYGRWDD